jgi:hypothetical protein
MIEALPTWQAWYAEDEADARIAELEAELAKKAEGLRHVGALALRHAYELEQRRAQVAPLEAERDAARADAEMYRGVLESVEWYQPSSNSSPSCPNCGRHKHQGHLVECELKAAIDAARSKE